ncbi:MAG: 16S rRNA (uracil(1498)-N(3))-methyltransferase [Chloroflexi bacterium]|nr:16S rRNA (uracil(1498)-N(3))-methyltransferase [Chloroflexota bacterium]
MTKHARFFVPPEAFAGDQVVILGQPVHRIRRVLRLRPGDSITLLDNKGGQYQVKLTALEQNGVRGLIMDKTPAPPAPATHITLYQALLRGDHFEYVLQKGTEIGVTAFVPLLCHRCEATAHRRHRWQQIIQEAAEQCRRGGIPTLYPPLPFDEACYHVGGLSLLPWEEETVVGLRDVITPLPTAVNILVGPEGGFTAQEVELARGQGIQVVTLGGHLLRSETAGVIAAAIVLYEKGELGAASDKGPHSSKEKVAAEEDEETTDEEKQPLIHRRSYQATPPGHHERHQAIP